MWQRIPGADIDKRMFIKEEMMLTVVKFKGKAIDVQVPGVVTFKVRDAGELG